MEQTFDIKAEIANILALCGKANPYGTKAQKEADEAFWLAVRRLDHAARGQHPVMPGRFVRLPAKDSYAYYIVNRVTKKAAKLIHVPYGLKYQSGAVVNGEADLTLIEDTLGWYDRIEALFAEKGKKPPLPQMEYGLRDETIEAEIERIMRDRGVDRATAIVRLHAVG